MKIIIKIGKKQRKGKWIKNTDHGGWHCSVCGHDNYMAYVDYDDGYELQDFYCPHCGAMVKK